MPWPMTVVDLPPLCWFHSTRSLQSALVAMAIAGGIDWWELIMMAVVGVDYSDG